MHELFLLIYRQPLRRIVFWMILLAFLWGWLGYREKGSLRWRVGNFLLFLGTVAAVFYMTVYTRGEGTGEAVLVPFQSLQAAKVQPEVYRAMLMNVFLFVPLGLTLPFVLGKGWFPGFFTVLAGLAFSAGIEYLQYRYALGWCEVDDVIMNTLGAQLGCLAHWLTRNWQRRVIPAWELLKKTFLRAVKTLRGYCHKK